MKEIKELKFHELTVEQKIGMVTCCLFAGSERTKESDEFVYDLIKKRAVGCVWINPDTEDFEGTMKKIKDLADYPLLVIADAEKGIHEYKIGRHNAIGMTGSEELAYEFGKVVAVTARNRGYNVICNPVVDMVNGTGLCGSNTRSLGNDKYKVTALAKAVARGMHDGGVLTVAKHYPGSSGGDPIDSHMAESTSDYTKEELLEYNLYPYMELNKEGLLDGIMTRHCRLTNIDPDYPASLSKKVIDIIRDEGFDGFAITDALGMMGIVAKFGEVDSKGMAIENGNDLALVWMRDTKKGYDIMYDCYKRGILSEERLNEATKKVLEAQHKVFMMQPKYAELTDEDALAIEKISTDSIYEKVDENVSNSISKDGKHLFIILADNEAEVSAEGKVDVDTFSGGWYHIDKITKKIKDLFPESDTFALKEYPIPWHVACALKKATEFDDVVFVTYMEGKPYMGKEEFSPRIISLMEAMQITEKISTIIHFGNPYALENLPHIPRIIIGSLSEKTTLTTLDVLAGDYPAKGVLTYNVKFK